MLTIKKTLKAALLTASVVALSACATGPQLAPMGAYTTGSMTVQLQSDWNAIPFRGGKLKEAKILTKDGPALNAVYLFPDIKDGSGLMREWRKERPVPRFDSSMSDLELAEFLTDSLYRAGGYTALNLENVRPDSYRGEDAVRFDLKGRTNAGLNIEGSALMSIIDERLNIIFFLAPSEYYAGKVRSEVDAMFVKVR